MFLFAQGRPPGLMDLLFPILLVMVMMYFISIKPQRKREKEHEEMLKTLKAGDHVVTTGGLYGTVARVQETTVLLRIADNVKVEFTRKSIAGKLAGEAEGGDKGASGSKK